MSLGWSAYGQDGTCAGFNGIGLQLRCPNSGCGEAYRGYATFSCSVDSCIFFERIDICCGAYQNYWPSWYCWMATFKNKEVRSRLLQLASARQILVPDCQGAYVPARLMLKNLQVSDHANI